VQQPAFDDENQLIDLRQFLSVVRRRKWTVILTAAVVVSLAIFMVYRRAPVYTSNARVEARPLTTDSILQGYIYDLQSGMDTEAQRVTSQSVVALAATELGISEADAQSLSGTVTASVPANTTYIDISCTRPTPQDATSCAQAFADAYVTNRIADAKHAYEAALENTQNAIDAAASKVSDLNSQLADATTEAERLSIQDQISAATREGDAAVLQQLAIPTPSPLAGVVTLTAELPSAPSNKNYITPVFLALIVGFALGIGLAFVRERLDERVTDRDHFEAALGAPILAIVPRVPGWRNRGDAKLVSVSAPDSAASEAYRAARTTLLYLAREGGLNAIAVTGPGQGEGKTTTTGNLAVSLAQIGKRVVMISCDLRKPRLHRFFGIENSVGVADVLMGLTDVPNALFKTQVPGLLIMPSGHTPHNPAELLASDAMDDLIHELRKVADYVILDTAPALVVADALGLAPKVDGVIVVADASKSHRSSLEFMASQLQRTGGQLVGGILNNLDPADSKRYASYGKYYRNYYQGADRYKFAEAPDNGYENVPPMPTNGNGVAANGSGSNGQSNGSQKKGRRLLPSGRKSKSTPPQDPQNWG
jgi:non-specific protein-tyrosine kinase